MGLYPLPAVVLCTSVDDWYWERLVSAQMLLSSALFLSQSQTAVGPAWLFPLAKCEQGKLCHSLAMNAVIIYSVKPLQEYLSCPS